MLQVPSSATNVKIEILDTKTPDSLWLLIEKMGFSKDRDYFDKALERQDLGELLIVMAYAYGQYVGYGLLNWQPKYTFFKLYEIPEIQDLNILREFRGQGFGTALIQYCENIAIEHRCDQMGIGVGLDSSFGAAQKLYVRLGYVPDGNGVSYDRKQVTAGEFRPIDENLCLMMVKSLN
jgi:GNAT superfamily N-acetyltransferase